MNGDNDPPPDHPVMLLECDRCDGDGYVIEGEGADAIRVTCDRCGGEGWY